MYFFMLCAGVICVCVGGTTSVCVSVPHAPPRVYICSLHPCLSIALPRCLAAVTVSSFHLLSSHLMWRFSASCQPEFCRRESSRAAGMNLHDQGGKIGVLQMKYSVLFLPHLLYKDIHNYT